MDSQPYKDETGLVWKQCKHPDGFDCIGFELDDLSIYVFKDKNRTDFMHVHGSNGMKMVTGPENHDRAVRAWNHFYPGDIDPARSFAASIIVGMMKK